MPSLVVCLLCAPAGASELAIHAPGQSGEPSLEELVEAGLSAYRSGDLKGADAAWARIREHYPAHPAAPVFEIKTLQARRTLDWWNEQYNAPIRARTVEAEEMALAWLERQPDSALARVFLGQALLDRMVIDGITGKYYAAGSAGERARKLLEEALQLDPDLVDAKSPLGTYNYYISIASKYIRLLSWLWFVPKGDRDIGLAYLHDATRNAGWFRFEAATTLASAYLYVEEEPELAEPILADLVKQHPQNSLLRFEVVELRLAKGDYPGTIEATEQLEQATGGQFGDDTRRTMARIWRARAELHIGRYESARAALADLQTRWDALSDWSRRWLLVTRANLHDLAGERAAAVALYERVTLEYDNGRASRSVEIARAGLDRPFRVDSSNGDGPRTEPPQE